MSANTVGTRPGAMSHRQIMEALSGLLLVLFVAMASSTIVSTALPKIIGALDGSQTQYTWVVTATLLTATASTPIWGKLADLYSKKLLVQISIVVFVLGSIIAGFSQTAGQLIAARAFQGLGMGGVQALVQVAIAAMIPPRERGRYNGYLGGVMALATVGGPLLGGLIVDTDWLGWRWCFFIGAPIAVIALVVLQKTLNLEVIRRANVKIDYLGAALIAAGVSVLLVWVSFVDSNFAWISWQTLAMVGPGLALLAAAVWVESRVAEPVVPLDIVKQRGTALSIIASLAVGMAMFGGAVFLGQYFQIGRGYSPTEAGLLTIPMMAGILVSSTVSGRMITKTGRIKPYIVAGTIVLVIGFAMLSFLDHETPLWYVGVAMALVGAGVGMSMQNLVLSVQNTVSLKDIGAASSTVAFFRSLGGTIGVSVLGAVLARRVSDQITHDLANAGVPAGSTGGGSTLNLAALPDSIQHIVRAAYGDATGHIFLISAAIAVIGVVAALLMRPTALRSTVDVAPAAVTEEEPVAALSR
ncbi:MDR family MFS transporter [Paractinoplanes lichenicola]|uniref:MFS transporter n=1 Tax=Paractinoplanes lichenicola TaxID=2802976 RepID=A0ABS1W523_9ACTN|nr:MDR family MFS transporter [Actinoplanes lichenicola]MBL7261820.1 MFS transporter [Actinoplanes lichenicola]